MLSYWIKMNKFNSLILIVALCALDFFVCGDELSKEESISFLPKFLSKPSVTYKNKHESITLNCSVEKKELWVMIWKKGSKQLTFLKNIFDKNVKLVKGGGKNDYSLTVLDLTDDYFGDYLCYSGHDKVEPQIHSVILYQPPEIIEGTMSEAENGKPMRLKCNVTGSPMPEVTWTKDGAEQRKGVKGEYGQVLLIDALTKSSAGEYTCTATNDRMEKASHTFSVELQNENKELTTPNKGTITKEEITKEVTTPTKDKLPEEPEPNKVTKGKGNSSSNLQIFNSIIFTSISSYFIFIYSL